MIRFVMKLGLILLASAAMCAHALNAPREIEPNDSTLTATPDAGLSTSVVGNTVTVTRTTAALPGSASIGVTVTSTGAAGTLLVAPGGIGC